MSLSTIFQKLTSLTTDVKTATRTVTDTIASLRGEIVAARRQLAAAREAPVPREELIQRFRALVDERGERFRRTPPPGQQWTSAASMLRPLASWERAGDVRVEKVDELFDLLCLVGRDAMNAGAARLAEIEGWQDGAPSAERPALIARLEREVTALEDAEERAVDAAVEVGVVVEHRPEVRERRYERQRRTAREDSARAKQAEIDRRAEQRREPDGVLARSHYLSQ
jgi:hypothetical protein